MGKEVKYEVDTPQKNPLKKKLKYGWMDEPEIFYGGKFVWKIEPDIPDAVFIGWTMREAITWARILNYKLAHVLPFSRTNYSGKLLTIAPDEDLPVYLCGSWVRKDAPENQIIELDDCMRYLHLRGFEFTRVDDNG
jgi:hypothetical protein